MAEPVEPPAPAIHRPRRWSPSLIWLVPFVAAAVGMVLVVRSYLDAGPSITIRFRTAEGIEAGKTEVRYREVVVGRVRHIHLAEDRSHIIVAIDLTSDAAGLAVEGSRFWVVRPRVDMAGISGLGTLLSGSYIGVDGGQSKTTQREFDGEETPPAVTSEREGRRFVLTADDLGSLNIGSPVYFRRVPVGRVVGYQLQPDGSGVQLQVFVDVPHDRFVTSATRFWNASGVDVSLKPSGLRVEAQSVATILLGGIAFQDDRGPGAGQTPAEAGATFQLYENRQSAFAPPDGPALTLRMRFDQSTRGLAGGAPIDFRGIELGSVKTIVPQYDARSMRFSTEVTAEIFPEHLGSAYDQLRAATAAANGGTADAPQVFAHLIGDGLRAQLRSGNLLTGQLYVALDFDPKAKRGAPPAAANPLDVPTMAGSLEQIQEQVASIVRRLDEVPFGQIGRNARDTLAGAQSLLLRLDTELAPSAKATLDEARNTLRTTRESLAGDEGLQSDLRGTLEQLDRAARSLRVLGDYLQRHPEAILRGRPAADEAPETPQVPWALPESLRSPADGPVDAPAVPAGPPRSAVEPPR